MKYLKYFENNTDIDAICHKYGIEDYTINSDGTVDVYGDVNIYNRRLTKLPLKFGYVSGGFWCYGNLLTTLEGAPMEVGGAFNCTNNQLTTLEGGPRKVGGSFYCYINKKLTSLKGAPEEVGGDFSCFECGLTSLEGAPKEIGGGFNFDKNPLPRSIKNNMLFINKIIEYQSDYNIWRRDGTLDSYRFRDMMKEIMGEELPS
jgi:hypothetical protein